MTTLPNMLRTAAMTLLVATVYFITGKFALMLAGPSGYATAIWPPAGVALAVLLSYGYKYVPALLLGAFAVNLYPYFSGETTLGLQAASYAAVIIAAGATLQAYIGARLVRHYVSFPNPLEQMRDITLLVILGGPVSCIVNATIGVLKLVIVGAIPWSNFSYSWLTWWVGDSIGVMIFTPILLLLFTPRLSVTVGRKIIVSLFLCATFAVAIYVFVSGLNAEQRRTQTTFEREAVNLANNVDNKLNSYFFILLSIERLYDASEEVSEDEFHSYVNKLFVEFPGLNALTWRQRIGKDQREQYEQAMAAQGRPGFKITQRDMVSGERHTAPEQDVYYPTTYIEYPDAREKLLGGDSYNDIARRQALDTARDTGQTVMTDRVFVFRDDKKLDAASIYHPIYDADMSAATPEERRQHLQGFISGSFVFSEMLQEVKDQAKQTGLTLELVDEQEDGSVDVLYDSTKNGDKDAIKATDTLKHEARISVGAQNWTLRVVPTTAYMTAHHSWEVWMVLAGGLLFTGLLGIFLLLVTARTDIIKRLVDKKTEQLLAQERALEEINRLNNAVLSSASYLIVATDINGKIIVYNREAERTLGYKAEEVLYTKTPSLWHDRQEVVNKAAELSRDLNQHIAPGYDVFITMPLLKGMERSEWNVVRKDGRLFPVELTVTPLLDSDDKPVGFLSIMQDITERRRIEKMKSEFISTVSHELRTPLTSIRGSLGLIAAGTLGQLPEKADGMVKIAHKNSERLVRIINDILDMEKIESGKMQMTIQAVNMSDFLNQAVESNAAYGDKCQVKFVLESLPKDMIALADPDRLMQVMSNLLSNAAKFSPAGGTVHVRARMSGGKIRVEVQDNGTGISEEFRDRIFEKFAQQDSSNTRKFDGTGLGLSITKKFIEAMNGRIDFDTELGKGTTFFFDLPQVKAENKKHSRHEEDLHGSILICEHDPHIQELMSAALNNAGFETDVAHTIEEVREKIKSNSYSAITLDLVMPDVNGMEFLRELRSNPATFNLPVVVVSVRTGETKKMLNGDALGVVDWLSKPVDQKKLVEMLRRSIQHNNEQMPRILHVEDDEDLTNILAESLRGRARFVSAPTLKDAYRELHSQRLDLLVLDLGMPDGNGLELLQHIRDNLDYTVPVLILSATETTQDVQKQVAQALVKSRMSEDKIIETIINLIRPGTELRETA